MPKPLGPLRDYIAVPLGETFAEHQTEQALHGQIQEHSMERTPIGDA